VNVIHVDIDDPIGTISPHLYGCLFSSCCYGMVEASSPIPNEGGFRTDLIEAMRRAGIGMLQWPAGDQAEYYQWRDGIGPRSERPLRKANKWFPGCDDLAFAPEDNALARTSSCTCASASAQSHTWACRSATAASPTSTTGSSIATARTTPT
jgi:hypothetical protein